MATRKISREGLERFSGPLKEKSHRNSQLPIVTSRTIDELYNQNF
jgi:hypothetical protein